MNKNPGSVEGNELAHAPLKAARSVPPKDEGKKMKPVGVGIRMSAELHDELQTITFETRNHVFESKKTSVSINALLIAGVKLAIEAYHQGKLIHPSTGELIPPVKRL